MALNPNYLCCPTMWGDLKVFCRTHSLGSMYQTVVVKALAGDHNVRDVIWGTRSPALLCMIDLSEMLGRYVMEVEILQVQKRWNIATICSLRHEIVDAGALLFLSASGKM
jgi:hypothetical protein